MLCWISCSNRSEQTSKEIQTETIPEVSKWADEYVFLYLNNNKDRIKEVNEYPVTFIKEIAEKNDRSYTMVKIGHSLPDRFVTDQVIYIDSLTKEVFEYDSVNDSLELWRNNTNVKPLNGEYRYDIAFAEWGGKSMGEKVTVIVTGDSVKVIYEGDGTLTAKKGEVLAEGILIKHYSGEWIIGEKLSDSQLEEVGGCTGGPAIIDFKRKRFWLC